MIHLETFKRLLRRFFLEWGLDLHRARLSFKRTFDFYIDCVQYTRRNKNSTFQLRSGQLYPCLQDKDDSAGQAKGHYFYQDIWAAREIFKAAPQRHLDIGSRIDGFVSHLLCFREVTVVDIRKLESKEKGLHFIQSDATNLLDFKDQSESSVSSLHAAEHFGLGRYGDPIEPEAYKSFMKSLQRILAQNGTLYFSVPCGKERLEFNAHRVFNPQRILNIFDELKCVELKAVLDDHELYDLEFEEALKILQSQNYACGLFKFQRLRP